MQQMINEGPRRQTTRLVPDDQIYSAAPHDRDKPPRSSNLPQSAAARYLNGPDMTPILRPDYGAFPGRR